MRPGECLVNLNDADSRSGVEVNLFLFRGKQKAEDEEAFVADAAVLADDDDRLEPR